MVRKKENAQFQNVIYCNYRTLYVNVFVLLLLGEYAHGLVGEGDGERGPMHPPNFDVYPHFTGAYGKAVGSHTIKNRDYYQ